MPRAVTAALAVLTLASISHRRAPMTPQKTAKAQAKKNPKAQFQAVLDEYQKAQAASQPIRRQKPTKSDRDLQPEVPQGDRARRPIHRDRRRGTGDQAAVNALTWWRPARGGGRRLRRRWGAWPRSMPPTPRSPRNATVGNSYSSAAETLLRAIGEKNRDRAARGNATLALAQYLNRKVEMIRTLKEKDKRARLRDGAIPHHARLRQGCARSPQDGGTPPLW